MKAIGVLFLIAFVIALVVLGPLATIWAANTLFPVLAIPYTFWTWLAVLVLGSFFRGNVNVKKS